MRSETQRKHRGHLILGASLLALAASQGAISQVAMAGNTGAEIATKGINGVPACVSCHGQLGRGNAAAGFPMLAGMGTDYLAEQLKLYGAGKRQNPIMSPFASKLSAQQQLAVAAYFSAMKPPKPGILPKPGDAADRQALQLLTQGDWARSLPACFSCHGPGGIGVAPSFPPLIGQTATYLSAQLDAWRNKSRPAGAGNLMDAMAERLKPEEIQAVAAYLARIPVEWNHKAAKGE